MKISKRNNEKKGKIGLNLDLGGVCSITCAKVDRLVMSAS